MAQVLSRSQFAGRPGGQRCSVLRKEYWAVMFTSDNELCSVGKHLACGKWKWLEPEAESRERSGRKIVPRVRSISPGRVGNQNG